VAFLFFFQAAVDLQPGFCFSFCKEICMSLAASLYHAKLIYFTSIDMDKDPAIMARWSQDASFLRLTSLEPALPASAARIKKQLEKYEKEQDESKNSFHFMIRTLNDERLVGYARLEDIEWANGTGTLQLAVGDPQDRRKGCGREALDLLLRYAFTELNLYRLHTSVPEYNQAALRLLQRAGFVTEVVRRQASNRDGRFWDVYILGLLQREWKNNQNNEVEHA
jgi:RimJ/RimL family protein N-acetyltransferase